MEDGTPHVMRNEGSYAPCLPAPGRKTPAEFGLFPGSRRSRGGAAAYAGWAGAAGARTVMVAGGFAARDAGEGSAGKVRMNQR